MRSRALILPFLFGGLVAARAPGAEPRGVELGARGATVTLVHADTVRARADTTRARADSVREYRGWYESGFEASWFHPCGAEPGDDMWWVTLTDDALRQRDSLTKALAANPRAVVVHWRGTVSPKMPMGAGHMGRGSRYMLVTEIVVVRDSDEKGCSAA